MYNCLSGQKLILAILLSDFLISIISSLAPPKSFDSTQHNAARNRLKNTLNDQRMVVLCPLFCFPCKYNNIDDEDSIYKGDIEDAVDRLSRVMKTVLQSIPDNVLSKNIRNGLLLPSSEKKTAKTEIPTESIYPEAKKLEYIWKGIPKRPYYVELSKRLVIQARWNHASSFATTEQTLLGLLTCRIGRPKSPSLLVPATDLGLTEIMPLSIPEQTQKEISENACLEWFVHAGDQGVLAVLGMRRTVGTSLIEFPPEEWQLMKAARVPHCVKTKRKKQVVGNNGIQETLTTAARARSKHAHRAQSGVSFFGVAKGKVEQQNLETELILKKMISEAVWMNFHMIFSKNLEENIPIFEIRTKEGYGARWSVKKIKDYTDIAEDSETAYDYDLQFRGFLEPTMENGHEKRWRH